MSGIFLSHSSKDKTFVTKLAADLVARGIPVWFDSWELETGESLFKRIFDGIDKTTYMLLALSPNSVDSKWVHRELEAALAKEDQLNRKVILPIKIADCQIPLSIAGRIYSDFTGSYLSALDELEDQLRRYKLHEVVIDLDRQLIPLKFSKGLFLDQINLQSRIEQLAPLLGEGQTIASNQFVVVPDPSYGELRSNFAKVVESISSHEPYSHYWEEHFNEMYQAVRILEKGLVQGVAAIFNGMFLMKEWAFFSIAAHWYARIIRNELLSRFERAWTFNQKESPKIFELVTIGALSSPQLAAKLFDVPSVVLFDVFKRSPDQYFKVWVDRESEVGHWFHENPQLPDKLRHFWSPTLIYQFVVPQMVARHYVFNTQSPLAWDLPDWMIGAS